MKKLVTFLSILLTASVAFAAGGAASLVAEKSTAKGFNYSWQTEQQFVRDCSFGANEQVCKCVIKELESEYSEETYLKFDEDLKNNIEHPDFSSFLSNATKKMRYKGREQELSLRLRRYWRWPRRDAWRW